MKFISLVLFLFSFNAFSTTHEEDLSEASFQKLIDTRISPDSVISFPIRNRGVSINAVILKNGIEEVVQNLSFKSDARTNCENGDYFLATADLSLEKFKILGDWNKEFELKIEGSCSEGQKLVFNYDSVGGEYFKVRNVAATLSRKLKEIDRDDFINGKIKIKFPSNGDYYNGTVNVTKGYQWDVVGHEIGHAIYAHGRIGRSGGGSHRIDECYSKALALSEGWASFFSAWVSVDLNDPMAKFEYMVPRRAPLEIEHVPSDVCKGPTNEWRVYSFLWDLIDLNNDNENISISFKDLWDLSVGKNFPSIIEFKDEILRKGFDPVIVNVVYSQNIEGL